MCIAMIEYKTTVLLRPTAVRLPVRHDPRAPAHRCQAPPTVHRRPLVGVRSLFPCSNAPPPRTPATVDFAAARCANSFIRTPKRAEPGASVARWSAAPRSAAAHRPHFRKCSAKPGRQNIHLGRHIGRSVHTTPETTPQTTSGEHPGLLAPPSRSHYAAGGPQCSASGFFSRPRPAAARRRPSTCDRSAGRRGSSTTCRPGRCSYRIQRPPVTVCAYFQESEELPQHQSSRPIVTWSWRLPVHQPARIARTIKVVACGGARAPRAFLHIRRVCHDPAELNRSLLVDETAVACKRLGGSTQGSLVSAARHSRPSGLASGLGSSQARATGSFDEIGHLDHRPPRRSRLTGVAGANISAAHRFRLLGGLVHRATTVRFLRQRRFAAPAAGDVRCPGCRAVSRPA